MLKKGMGKSQTEEAQAVEAGYWHCFRFNPEWKAQGKNQFVLDSKTPTADYEEFLNGEVRYQSLAKKSPQKAVELFANAKENAESRYEYLNKLVTLYAVDEEQKENS